MTKDEIYDAMVQCCETFRYDIWPEAIDRLADAVLAASQKPKPYHSFEKCAEEVWQELASATPEPVGEVYMLGQFKRYDKHGVGHEAGGVLSVRLFKELPVGTKLYTERD